MTRLARTLLAGAAAAVGAVLAARPELRHHVRRGGDAAARHLQRLAGQWQGARYRLAGRVPDPDVDDATLADRVRSSIGPVVKRLDLPHVHVMAEEHVVLLHGEVSTPADARVIEEAVRAVSGVDGVESYLHVGLLDSDTRPSSGRQEPSEQYRRVVAAVRAAGVDEEYAAPVARAVLAAFGDGLPDGERGHVLAHLSPDVRAMAEPPRRHGRRRRLRSVTELVDAVSARAAGVSGEEALRAARAVLAEIRRLVPEERKDVAAVLPAELRALWDGGT
jgi:uncharacterized protein (DUF2267 family)